MPPYVRILFALDGYIRSAFQDSASDGMAEDTLVGQINASVIEKELVYYERRVAELEELVSGKDAALRSMSEDLERLQSGAGDSNAVSDEQEVQSLQVETQKLAAHVGSTFANWMLSYLTVLNNFCEQSARRVNFCKD